MTIECDLAIIGGGPGGYVAAIRAGQLGMRTVCIDDRELLGGTCLNVGCIPSKTLLHSTEFYEKLYYHGQDFGIDASSLSANFAQMMRRKTEVLTSLGHGVEMLLKKHKVTRIQGRGRLTGPNTIHITDSQGSSQEVKAKSIILATGSEPIPLPFAPFDEERIVSSTGALALRDVPKRLLLVGAGVIGLELGSVYRRLGSEVTVVEFLDHVCPTLDRTLSQTLYQTLRKQGLTFHLSSKVVEAKVAENQVHAVVESSSGERQTFTADVMLVAIGRRPFTQGLGLQELGIELEKGFVKVNDRFQTAVPSILAIGDLVDGPMLAHKASEEGVVVVDLLVGRSAHVNYVIIPTVVYTWPEVAGVGLTEERLKALALPYRAGTFPFKATSRARCTGDVEGLVKVLACERTDRLLGVHIIGPNAGELIAEGVTALEGGLTATELGAMSHAHPTLAEAIKEAALALHKQQIHL